MFMRILPYNFLLSGSKGTVSLRNKKAEFLIKMC